MRPPQALRKHTGLLTSGIIQRGIAVALSNTRHVISRLTVADHDKFSSFHENLLFSPDFVAQESVAEKDRFAAADFQRAAGGFFDSLHMIGQII